MKNRYDRASIPLHTLTLKLGIVQLKICKWQIQNHNEHSAHLESDHKNAGVTVAEGSETEAASHATKLKAATANKTQQACWFPMTTTDPSLPHSRVLCENPESNLLLLRSGWSRSYFRSRSPGPTRQIASKLRTTKAKMQRKASWRTHTAQRGLFGWMSWMDYPLWRFGWMTSSPLLDGNICAGVCSPMVAVHVAILSTRKTLREGLSVIGKVGGGNSAS